MFTPTKRDGTIAGPARLSVRVVMEPPGGATTEEEKKEHHYSMGTKAHLSFQPDPETGTGVVPVEGGPGANMFDSTNWYLVLKSLWDCGMPQDYVDNDLSVLEGITVHITNVPEPEERKGFRSSTSEVAPEQRDRKVPVVSEVISAPWIEGAVAAAQPAAKPAAVPAKAAAAPAKLAAKPNGAAAAPPPAPAPADDAQKRAVEDALAVFLADNPNGGSRAALRLRVNRELAAHPDKTAIMDAYLGDDTTLGAVLEPLGYKISGASVVLK
jgi:hypothetical protein